MSENTCNVLPNKTLFFEKVKRPNQGWSITKVTSTPPPRNKLN